MSLSEMTEDEQRHIMAAFREAHGYELDRLDLERGMEVAKLAFCLLPKTPGRGEDTVRFERPDGKRHEAPAWLVELLGKFDRGGAETERALLEARAECEQLKQERDGFAKDLCRWLGDDEGRRLCREAGEG